MTDSERRRGWVFFALYLLVFPYLNAWAQRLLMGEGEAPVAEANVVYYVLLFALALLVFWTFLRHGFSLLVDWLPENAFAFVTGLAGAGLLHFLVTLIPYPVQNPSEMQYLQEFAISPVATAVLLVVLIPLIEETLFRGLVFGSLRQYSRPLAYVVSVLVYALACVWRYALEIGDPAYLLLFIQYLPMSLALAWCYDNGGSIWSAVALHMTINGFMLFSIVH
ncbi:CPBP family intramembrane metalloprotease [Pseudoflavonifractor sp. BIOML-A6]|uniref:CPBP family intramembrane metalloprotease n=2 Tax=Lawsonibacter faecis TaxID=2763052 RepID=A0A8J6JL49_9FIRM|nr:CPBP family intramembrane metalloprotease [Lawsonibacter faecis]MTQ95630.1 CPBP family intramembrane metalloprotease [Pseudoflavonifractor sp. BIOML-A16]MTR05510.1 CPBP family intramembrane metalloprotease [Pseudoflavonifractor sp. BIOML-A15]MTR13288.1 CPBP family intramembrane metalloprotease [Pseudoflavonifractor sp. BIOML-A17]MTR20725.1 CPBP family intramembrane metalloprotease [Pseudoflavonifractor sp. BIOML-A19]MTR34018.1 CPBP family intramembrane metalloprotease [Pseudoflavonifractor 